MGEQRITRDMTIGELIQKYPEAAPIVMSYGLHCVGCHVAHWETLEQGARGHGLPEDVIDEMIDELNKFVEEQSKEAAEEAKP